MNYQEFSAKVKSKYPEYANVDDRELAQRIVSKYPEYQGKVEFPSSSKELNVPQQSFAQNLASDYADAVMQGPAAMLAKIPETAHKIASRGGDILQSEMQMRGTNPTLARAANIAVSYSPDVMSMVASPIPSQGTAENIAIPAARRALGFSKRMLNTPQSRNAANTAARVALEENVIPFSGSTDEMALRAQKLATDSGYKIGQLRDSVGPVGTDEVVSSLESLRDKLTKGRVGGEWDKIHARIDNAVDTVKALGTAGGDTTLNELADAKKRIADSVNWLADNTSQRDTKKIVASIENGINDIFRSKGGDLPAYGQAKRQYGAAMSMKKAIDNEQAGQQGNNLFSLPTVIAASGELAGGSPTKALATLGIVEKLKRSRYGISANVLNNNLPLLNAGSLVFSSAIRKAREQSQ